MPQNGARFEFDFTDSKKKLTQGGVLTKFCAYNKLRLRPAHLKFKKTLKTTVLNHSGCFIFKQRDKLSTGWQRKIFTDSKKKLTLVGEGGGRG